MSNVESRPPDSIARTEDGAAPHIGEFRPLVAFPARAPEKGR